MLKRFETGLEVGTLNRIQHEERETLGRTRLLLHAPQTSLIPVADLEIGSATGVRSAPVYFWVATPTSGHTKVQTAYLEATLGCLEISKELVRECNCSG